MTRAAHSSPTLFLGNCFCSGLCTRLRCRHSPGNINRSNAISWCEICIHKSFCSSSSSKKVHLYNKRNLQGRTAETRCQRSKEWNPLLLYPIFPAWKMQTFDFNPCEMELFFRIFSLTKCRKVYRVNPPITSLTQPFI